MIHHFQSFHDVPISCINHAAREYHIPAQLILAVISIEGGRNGMAISNVNGSLDYGVMQINSIWLKQAKNKGYAAYQLQYEPCKNVEVGTWILSQEIHHTQDLKKAIGNYHSHTLKYNNLYATQVLAAYQIMHTVLDPVLSKKCLYTGAIC